MYDKMQWCRDTIDYVNCAEQFLINCDITFVRNEADQLQSFIDYITKLSNINCPGGIKGCENSTGDMRCILGVRYFTGEYNFNGAETRSKSSQLLLMCSLMVYSFLRFFWQTHLLFCLIFFWYVLLLERKLINFLIFIFVMQKIQLNKRKRERENWLADWLSAYFIPPSLQTI